MNLNLTYDIVKAESKNLDWPFFTDKMDINIFGVRSSSLVADMWNDLLGVAWIDDFGSKNLLQHMGTTKPGLYWLKKKMGNSKGTAILPPNFYRACWVLGKHNNKYEALVQYKMPFMVWRDNNQDGRFDYQGDLHDDVTGLNMHTESLISDTEKVGAYSAGCQTRRFDRDHFMFMNLVKRSMVIYGPTVSYKLFTERTFIKL